jgi:hypothetical protein
MRSFIALRACNETADGLTISQPSFSFVASSSSEKLLQEFVATDLEMVSHISQDARQRADFQRAVIRDCEVMLAAFNSREPKMASVLARHLIPEAA